MKEDITMLIDDLKIRAEKLYDDGEGLERLINKARQVVEENEVLNSLSKDIESLLKMMEDWINGDYTNISKDSIIMSIVCLLYIVNPFGIIPEKLKIGFIGDLLATTYLLKLIKIEIIKYRDMEAGIVRQLETGVSLEEEKDTGYVEIEKEDSESDDKETRFIEL